MADHGQLRDWLVQAAAGDERAAELAFVALWPLVLGYCHRMLCGWPGSDPAEDIAQSVMTRLLEDVTLYDDRRSPVAWAVSAAYWQCRTERARLRRARLRAGREVDETIVAAEKSAEEIISDSEEREVLAGLVAALAPEQRALLQLPGSDITTLESIPPATLRKRRSRLLATLRRAVRDIVAPPRSGRRS